MNNNQKKLTDSDIVQEIIEQLADKEHLLGKWNSFQTSDGRNWAMKIQED